MLLACLLLPVSAWPQRVYTVAVVPQHPPVVIRHNWRPVLDGLSRAAGVRLRLLQYRSIPAFEKAVLAGIPDIAYMNPWHMVMARERQGYVPLLRDGRKRLVGILVVRRDSGIRRLSDLDGKRIGFPAPNAFGASLYMRALLHRRYGLRFESRYFRTHTNVYRNLALGTVSAGGGVQRTLDAEPRRLRRNLRVLYKTPGVASHPVAVHARVPKTVRERLYSAFVSMASDPRTRGLMRKVSLAHPVRADYAADYAILRRLGLERFTVAP